MNAFVRPAKHVFIPIDEIDLSHTIRPYNAAVVSELAQSIRAIGLQTPLTCIVRDGQHVLVSGRNRLEALRIIGCEQAPVRIVDFDDVDAELWRLSENLHRAELTKLEYDKQVVRYAELLKAKQAGETAAQESEIGLVPEGDKVRQVGAVSDGEGISRQVGAKVGRPESGNKLVARELNIPEQTVRRAYQTASSREGLAAYPKRAGVLLSTQRRTLNARSSSRRMQCSPRMPNMPKPRSGRSTLAPRHSPNDLGTRPHERLRQTRQARVHSDRRDRPQPYDLSL